MVIGHIKRFFENQKMRLAERRKEKEQSESFKETEEMRKAEEIKREADRLAQLKQYTTAIEEYNKALEFYPYKGNEADLFKNAAGFLFKCNYNMAACYSYLDNFDEAIKYFDKGFFSAIIHDPPRMALSPELYTLEFYQQLFRVLKKGGKLYHYTGSPGEKRGISIAKGVVKRLKEAGFQNAAERKDVLGVVASK